MSMGERPSTEQKEFWIATQDIVQAEGHPFYEKLNQVLKANDFDRFVEGICKKFYKEVLGRNVDLSKVVFPVHDDIAAYMAVTPALRGKEDLIMDKYVKKWGIGVYKYLSPISDNIRRDKEQARPKGIYVFGHRGGDEPDDIHRNKSYNIAVKEDFPFANPVEYLLMTGFHRFTKGYFMDRIGWTRTSSLWSDGDVVGGSWSDGGGELDMSWGGPGSADPGSGPRELFR